MWSFQDHIYIEQYRFLLSNWGFILILQCPGLGSTFMDFVKGKITSHTDIYLGYLLACGESQLLSMINIYPWSVYYVKLASRLHHFTKKYRVVTKFCYSFILYQLNLRWHCLVFSILQQDLHQDGIKCEYFQWKGQIFRVENAANMHINQQIRTSK